MQHLDEGTIHALADGELEPAELAAAEAHLAACPACRTALEEARQFAREADSLLGTIDVPPHRSGARQEPAPVPVRPASRHHLVRNLVWAASLVLAAGLGYFASDLRLAREVPLPDLEESKVALDTARTPAPAPRLQSPADVASSSQPVAREEAEAAPRNSLAARDETQRSLTDAPAGAERGAAALQPGLAAAAPLAPAAAAADSLGQVLRPITLDQATRLLGGRLALLGGLAPVRVLSAEGTLPTLGAASGPVVRLVYPDAPGRELWLDQTRDKVGAVSGFAAQQAAAPALLTGDTLALGGEGRRTVRWLGSSGARLALSGHVSADSLRALVQRVR
jgi:putative zinc finger protein